MELSTIQKSVSNSQDLPNSPPDKLSSIKTAAAHDAVSVLSSRDEVKQENSTLAGTSNNTKSLSSETLQKLKSNPAFYNALCFLFQAKNKTLQNTGQNSFSQLQQLQQSSQHLTQQNPNQLSEKSGDDSQSESPDPSGRKSPSLTTISSKTKQNQNKPAKKNEKNSKSKKYKSKYLSKNKRKIHSYQNHRFDHPQKIIFTPTFEYINFSRRSSSNLNRTNSYESYSEEDNVSLDDFDLVEAHKRLEIFEDRIIAGKSKYVHPACSVLLEKEETEKCIEEGHDIIFTEDEILLSQQYDQAKNDYETVESQKIPLFWEKRSWDQSKDKMDVDENEALILRISDYNDFSYRERRSLSSRKKIQQLRHRRHHNSIRERLINKGKAEIIDDDISNYEYEYEENSDELNNAINSNSDFISSDASEDGIEDEDRSGSYHYHISGTNSSNADGKRHIHKKLQRTKSSPIPRNFGLHHAYNNNGMVTRTKVTTKRSNEERAVVTENNNFDIVKQTEPSNKKDQAQYGRQLKKSSKGTRTNTKMKIPKIGPNSATIYISNLYYETDDSGDDTDAELF